MYLPYVEKSRTSNMFQSNINRQGPLSESMTWEDPGFLRTSSQTATPVVLPHHGSLGWTHSRYQEIHMKASDQFARAQMYMMLSTRHRCRTSIAPVLRLRVISHLWH